MSRIGHSLLAYAVVKFLGEIEPHKQGARAEACLLANGNWTTGTVHLDWLCARPHASRLALKICSEILLRSCAPSRRADGTHERERAAARPKLDLYEPLSRLRQGLGY